MEVAVDRSTGAIAVKRVVCAHDCGLVVNPDALRNQIEGAITQTLSRALQQVQFDTSRDQRGLGQLSDSAFHQRRRST